MIEGLEPTRARSCVQPEGRLEIAKSIGQSSMTHKLVLSAPDDLDPEALGWLRRAYEANA